MPRRELPRYCELPSIGGGQWGRSRRSSPKAREMLRILVYVAALVALFAGAIMYGGNAIGAWDPLPPAPTPPPAVKLAKAKPKECPAPTSPPTSTKRPRLTPAQKLWVKKADALCRESRAAAQAVMVQGNTST